MGRSGFEPAVGFVGRRELVLLVGRCKPPLLLEVESPGNLVLLVRIVGPGDSVVSVGFEGSG